MKHRLVHIVFCLAILLLTLGGCAALREKPEAKEPPEVRLEKVLLERALACERKGQSQKALQLYEAALAVIADKKKGLEESLRCAAADRRLADEPPAADAGDCDRLRK